MNIGIEDETRRWLDRLLKEWRTGTVSGLCRLLSRNEYGVFDSAGIIRGRVLTDDMATPRALRFNDVTYLLIRAEAPQSAGIAPTAAPGANGDTAR